MREKVSTNKMDWICRLLESYRCIKGPAFQEIDANDDIELVQKKVLQFLVETFPALANDGDSPTHLGKSVG